MEYTLEPPRNCPKNRDHLSLKKVGAEWDLVCLALNIKRLQVLPAA